jgi:enoyl-CoA hydratase/carnithine racemase
MALWQVESTKGVAVATYTNPPMNYFCAQGTQELGELIRGWSDPSVRALAADLAELSPVAIAEIKRAVYRGSDLPLDAGLAIESESFMTTMFSPEGLATMREYVALPLEKRRDWLERRAGSLHPRRGRG